MVNRIFKNRISLVLFLILSSLCFWSCNGLFGGDGTLTLMLPGASSRGGDSSYIYNIELSGPSSQTKTGESGETIVFENLEVGDYEVLVEAFEKESKYYYAAGSAKATVEAGATSSVSIKLEKVILTPYIVDQAEVETVTLVSTGTGTTATGSANLFVTAKVGDDSHSQGGSLSYEWYACSESGVVTGSALSFIENYSITYSSADANQTYYYRCQITYTVGDSSQSIWSEVIKVSVGNVRTLQSISAVYNYSSSDSAYAIVGDVAIDNFTITETYTDGTTGVCSNNESYSLSYGLDSTVSTLVGDVPYKITYSSDTTISCTCTVTVKYNSSMSGTAYTGLTDNIVTVEKANGEYSPVTISVGTDTVETYYTNDGTPVADTISYQWYSSESESGEGTAIEGAKGSSYTFTPSEGGTTYVYCVKTLTPSDYSVDFGSVSQSQGVRVKVVAKALESISASVESSTYFTSDSETTTINHSAFTVTKTYNDGTSSSEAATEGEYNIGCTDGADGCVGNVPFTITYAENEAISCTCTVPVKYKSTAPTVTVACEPESLAVGTEVTLTATIDYKNDSESPSAYFIYGDDADIAQDTYSYGWYESGYDSVSDFSNLTPLSTGIISSGTTLTTTYTPNTGTKYLYCVVSVTPGKYSTSYSTTTVLSGNGCYEVEVSAVTGENYSTWNDLSTAVLEASGGETFIVTGNMTADSVIEVSKKITIIADSDGCTISRDNDNFCGSASATQNCFFKVTDGGNLILGSSGGSLVLDGGYNSENESNQAAGAIIWAYQSGTATSGILRIEIGQCCTIQNNYNSLTGYNRGGGICYYLNNCSTKYTDLEGVVLSGGAIKNCRGTAGGAIYYKTDSGKEDSLPSLYINSGTISGNSTISNGQSGGGIKVEGGVLMMSGGTISGNSMTAQSTSSAQGGGGIYVSDNGKAYLFGGSITGNTATSGLGGGIYNSSETTYLPYGSTVTIKDNNAGTYTNYNPANVYSCVTVYDAEGSTATYGFGSTGNYDNTDCTYIENGNPKQD